ncbi:MAG: DUF2156 domain-containing protein [Deltaproteobacteria bacterium]|nr:DUF2156 domain-containing protein [Deltaproteobacteria bacterium]
MSRGLPRFPDFKPLALEDRQVIQPLLWDYQPDTSELTFTNLFIWKDHYHFVWCLDGDCLLVAGAGPSGAWGYPPVGPGPRADAARRLLTWLREEKGEPAPRLERADARLAAELSGQAGLTVEPVRDHFDYVYLTADLIHLAGNKYHAKRNHLNSFRQAHAFSYVPMGAAHLPACLALTESWCRLKRCEEDLSLMGEWAAVRLALRHVEDLALTGGVVLVDGRVEAFALGELLNRDTAVVHIEKANPEIRGLYALINQQFCEQAWSAAPFINREQDLGEPCAPPNSPTTPTAWLKNSASG